MQYETEVINQNEWEGEGERIKNRYDRIVIIIIKGIQECNGWSVVLAGEDDELIREAMGCDYVMDLISEMEIAPAFPVSKNSLLMGHDRIAPKVK